MSQILQMASEFIERMSNPAYGIQENESYTMHFGSLLASEGFDSALGREISEIKDPNCLTPHGWLWLLNWVRSKEISLDDNLLMHLSETFSNVFMQVLVIDVATRHTTWERKNSISHLHEFPHPWLRKLLRRCVEKSNDDQGVEHEYIETRRSETILVALMQVGGAINLDAASTLLNHRWAGQPRLVEFFWSLCNELDEETRDEWISHLKPPQFEV
jgi:hypothetical protein